MKETEKKAESNKTGKSNEQGESDEEGFPNEVDVCFRYMLLTEEYLLLQQTRDGHKHLNMNMHSILLLLSWRIEKICRKYYAISITGDRLLHGTDISKIDTKQPHVQELIGRAKK